ncbi:MAG: hypothetical protein IJZ53_06395 [Tyzzerella sp.]|nr:hypothetical protein [Tyzzerella sp.]
MKTYKIGIEEIVSAVFEVEAEDSEKALEIAKEKYRLGEFVLEPGELQSKNIAVLEPESTEWKEF